MTSGIGVPGGYTVFCDDIRQEVNGKLTLVGSYAGAMHILNGWPAKLTQLSALVVVRFPNESAGKTITVRIIRSTVGQDDEVLIEAEIVVPENARDILARDRGPLIDAAEPTFSEFRFTPQFPGIEFTAESRIKVRGYLDGEEFKIGSLIVREGPPPPPPLEG